MDLEKQEGKEKQSAQRASRHIVKSNFIDDWKSKKKMRVEYTR